MAYHKKTAPKNTGSSTTNETVKGVSSEGVNAASPSASTDS